LQSITTASGRKVTLSYSTAAMAGITPSAGYLVSATDNFNRALQFKYDTNGQLSEFVDPSGQSIKYVHEATNAGLTNPWSRMLKPIQVTFQDGSIKSYFWDEPSYAAWDTNVLQRTNLLTGMADEAGNRFATFTYKNGKAVSTEHGVGIEKYTFFDQRPVPGQGVGTVTIIDPLNTSRDMVFNWVNGYPRLVSQSQPAGSGCNASSQAIAYDANGNVSSVDDFNGHRTCIVSDVIRNTETTRIEGLTNTAACTNVTGSGAVLPVGSRKINRQWHPDWNIETRQAEPLKITTWVYNGQPDPTAGNAVASCAPATALLPDGKPILVLCKQVEQATTDANGALGWTAVATGTARVRNYTYNAYGQLLTEKDPRGNTTTYAYYAATTASVTAGDLQTATNAVGHVTTYGQYDKAGRVLQVTDPNGVVTNITYKPRGWVESVSTTLALNSAETTTYSYDLVGQRTGVMFSDGTSLTYKYDAAHRLTDIVDSAGNTVTYIPNNMGQPTEERLKDPKGVLARNISRSYDALGRVQKLTGVRP
jgi:YD repeat-containing protein